MFLTHTNHFEIFFWEDHTLVGYAVNVAYWRGSIVTTNRTALSLHTTRLYLSSCALPTLFKLSTYNDTCLNAVLHRDAGLTLRYKFFACISAYLILRTTTLLKQLTVGSASQVTASLLWNPTLTEVTKPCHWFLLFTPCLCGPRRIMATFTKDTPHPALLLFVFRFYLVTFSSR